jgi:uncharacterized membrane protein YdjX (TVP38/TMEM64 family)
MEKQKQTILTAKIVLLVLFLAIIVVLSIKFTSPITRLMSQPGQFREFLTSFGPLSALIYIAIQVAHVIIVVIPGEIVQMAGGYVFGTALGTLYAVIGILLGTMIVFFATKLLGFSLVRTFVSQRKLEKFDFLINSPKSEIAMFVLFLIPGIPKDTLVYIAGLTPIKPFKFLLIAMIARFPGLLGSAYIGANLQERHYLPVWIISAVALVLFVVGIFAKDKVIDWIHRHWHRRTSSPSN